MQAPRRVKGIIILREALSGRHDKAHKMVLIPLFRAGDSPPLRAQVALIASVHAGQSLRTVVQVQSGLTGVYGSVCQKNGHSEESPSVQRRQRRRPGSSAAPPSPPAAPPTAATAARCSCSKLLAPASPMQHRDDQAFTQSSIRRKALPILLKASMPVA